MEVQSIHHADVDLPTRLHSCAVFRYNAVTEVTVVLLIFKRLIDDPLWFQHKDVETSLSPGLYSCLNPLRGQIWTASKLIIINFMKP